jgi:hypothetical protein
LLVENITNPLPVNAKIGGSAEGDFEITGMILFNSRRLLDLL